MVAGTPLVLFLCGDVMTGRGVDQLFPCRSSPRLYEPFVDSALDYVRLAERASGPIPRRVDAAYVWGVLPVLCERLRPDVRIINLETSVTTSDDAAPKAINYRMHPRNVAVLTAARVDCCVLANNHVLDWGRAGLLETLETLARAGIRVAGAGRELAAARAPAVLEVAGDRRVLVFAFGAADAGVDADWAAGVGTAGIHVLADLSEQTVDGIARLVSGGRRPGDVVVASVHWGHNWGYAVPRAHRRFAHALVDRAHVDVVHGHSSHHPMAIEVHHGRPIFYGCGDFLNDYEGIPGHERFRGDLVLAYFPALDARTGELVRLTMMPLQIRRFRLTTPAAADRDWLRDVLDRECRRFGHRVTLHDDVLALEWW
jgi:poly-gamma-glutamate capsule biosynthesis protein CapA/YwtB (metallophosphatase superfamily)